VLVREACGHSARDPAVVAARAVTARGAEFCTHAGRIWRGLNGGREFGGSHTKRFSIDIYDHVQSLEIRRSQPHGAGATGNFFRRAIGGVCGQSPACGRRGRRSNATMLVARIRKERRSAGASSFVLDVSIEVSPGITILFGAFRAGKSTLLDCVAGLTRPDQGQIAAGGEVLFDSARGSMFPRRSGEPPTFSDPGAISASERGRKRCIRIDRPAEGRKTGTSRSNSKSLSRGEIAENKGRTRFLEARSRESRWPDHW